MIEEGPSLRKRPHANRPNWFIYIPGTLQTKATWLPTGTSDETEARKLLDAVKRDGIPQAAQTMKRDAMTRVYWRRLLKGKGTTVRAAIDDYLAATILQGKATRTVESVGQVLDLWARHLGLGASMIAAILVEHVGPWLNDSMTLAYSTRNQRLKVLTAFFDWCVQGELMPINPCQKVFVRTANIPQDKLVEKKKVPFTDDEVEKLLATISRDHWLYGAVLIGKYFGLRIGAVTNLEWASLPDFKRLRIFTHKGRVVVDEPLPDEAAAWFRTWPVIGGSGLCFPAAAAGNGSADFAGACAKAGIVGKSFHCLRVRVVTNGINAVLDQLGGEERAVMSGLLVKHGVAGVQKLVGHVAGSAITSGRYFNPQPRATSP